MTEAKTSNKGLFIKDSAVNHARLSEDQKYIIDSEGNRVEYDDPRVVILAPSAQNRYGKGFVEHIYKTRNRKIRIADEITPDILQYAKSICSGKECLPCFSISGAILKDLSENRSEDEITLIRNPADQDGPCCNGAWEEYFGIMAKKVNMRNVIFAVSPRPNNKYLGFDLWFFRLEHMLYTISHYMIEARNALQCIAVDKKSALEEFDEITQRFTIKVEDDSTLKSALAEWADDIRKIPTQKSLPNIPKVLIIGGLNLMFCHYPVEEYFLEQGIIPRVVDVGETIEWFISEYAVRYGFKRGDIEPKKQISFRRTLRALPKNNPKEYFLAVLSTIAVKYLGWKLHFYRKIMTKSGLLFDECPSLKEGSEYAYKYISHNGFTETSITTARFLHALKTDVYDGIINLGCFNCAPAMNSQAIIRPIANQSGIPYAAIDVEAPILSANQLRVLETISYQVKRWKEKKNNANSTATL